MVGPIVAELRRWPVPVTLDDVFVERYPQLVTQALQLTAGDRVAAEDLVHDTFVRLALRSVDPARVQNLDGYLFVTMRNVHLSQVRRRVLQAPVNVSAVDYESIAERLLAVADDHAAATAYDELALVTKFACLRKATSKAASALILRYFHGYYPGEIARILHATEQAVDTRLRIARAEARAFVAAPDRLTAIGRVVTHLRFGRPNDADFVLGLRKSIFGAITGACPSPDDFRQIYDGPSTDPLDVQVLAHVVSCATCLDELNRRLGLPLLQERDPSDMLGRGRRNGGGKSGPPNDVGDRRASLRSRLKEALDQRPKELRVAVNGLFVGSQVVSGGFCEQRIRVLTGERLGFIEVFSEYGVCLLYTDVTPPPDGFAEQGVRVELSAGRTVSVRLTFTGEDPFVEVVYCDPQLHATSTPADDAGPGRARNIADDSGAETTSGLHWRRFWPGRWLISRPGIATLLTVTVLAGTWWAFRDPTVTAAELLSTARAGEAIPLQAGTASHRVLSVEQRTRPASTILKRNRIEVWKDGTKGTRAVRLYDEQSRVVAGLWTAQDGTRTRYEVGQRPTVESKLAPSGVPTVRDVWTRDLSADAFLSLVGNLEDTVVVTHPSTYVISNRPNLEPGADGLVEASLTLVQDDHRATDQLVVIRENGSEHEFHWREVRTEVVPIAALTSTIFEPEAVLLGLPEPTPILRAPLPPVPPVVPLRPKADGLFEIELDATYRLFRSHLWVGAGADVLRVGDQVLIRAHVPTESSRADLDAELANVKGSSSVQIEISVHEAPLPAEPSANATSAGPHPISGALERLFGSDGSEAERDKRASSFVSDIVTAVERRRVRLGALRELITRWPSDRLLNLRVESVATWQVMVHGHADAVRRETEWMQSRLSPLVGRVGEAASSADSTTAAPPQTVEDAARAVADLTSYIERQDDILRAATAVCRTPCGEIDGTALLQSFSDVDAVVALLARFYLRIGRGAGPSPQSEK
jgi:RNA polymerase sigma factor (sigma-70 family)